MLLFHLNLFEYMCLRLSVSHTGLIAEHLNIYIKGEMRTQGNIFVSSKVQKFLIGLESEIFCVKKSNQQ